MMPCISEVRDALWKQENDDEKRYALTLSILTFGLLPAFLELINMFIGNGVGNLMKWLLLLCTIASYTILGTATWRMTRFMREGTKDRATFFGWGFYLFCIEAAVLSVLLLWYQHHLEDSDVVLVNLMCTIWTVSGLVAAAGSVLNIMLFRLFVRAGIKEQEKEQERLCRSYFSLSNYDKPEQRMHHFLSAVLCGLSLALLLGFVDIAFHAYFKYDEPWMAAAATFAYTALTVTAIRGAFSMPLPVVHHPMLYLSWAAYIPSIIVYGRDLACLTMDHHDRAKFNKHMSGVAIFLMCHVSYLYVFGRL